MWKTAIKWHRVLKLLLFFRIILKYYEEITSSVCTEFVCIFYLYCGNVLLKETAQKIIVHSSGDCFVYMRESALRKNLPAALFYISLKEQTGIVLPGFKNSFLLDHGWRRPFLLLPLTAQKFRQFTRQTVCASFRLLRGQELWPGWSHRCCLCGLLTPVARGALWRFSPEELFRRLRSKPQSSGSGDHRANSHGINFKVSDGF